jgi:ABC-type Zn uptake system ZnuABC Zn-binding protein ZnuA
VVTSTTVFADFVRQVGGDLVRVRALAPAGTDPHTFQPTPDTIKALVQARAAFYNGAGLEEWWEKLVRSGGRKDLVAVELSAGLATRRPAGGSQDGHGDRGGVDPHAWLDPVLAQTYVDRIREGLSRVDPVNAPAYAERTARYRRALDELNGWIRAEIERVPASRRKLVTFHDAFQYFAARYGLAVRGFVVASPGKEPSAKAMAELTRLVKQEQVPAVFAEADFNAKLLESLARDAGVKVVTTLYDGSLSTGPPADTYLALMRHNVTQIAGALR